MIVDIQLKMDANMDILNSPINKSTYAIIN